MTIQTDHQGPPPRTATIDALGLLDLAAVALKRWRLIAAVALGTGALAFGVSLLITPQFTAKITFLPPQSNGGSSLSAALATLGPLASLATAGSSKTPGDLYLSLLESETVADRMIAHFRLRDLYKTQYQFEARDVLKNRSQFALGKKDGIISVEVDDTDPQRAAAMAAQYVVELREITANMALTEAQRKRAFFEEQLQKTRDNLNRAQTALQASGFSQGALRSLPTATAEEYSRLKSGLTAAEVQESSLKTRLAEGAPELAQLRATAAALQARLHEIEQQSAEPSLSADYVGKYRDFKYQESLFELLSKQFEAARLEESKDDTVIQVVDRAQVPEWKSKPKRSMFALAGMILGALTASVIVVAKHVRAILEMERRPTP